MLTFMMEVKNKYLKVNMSDKAVYKNDHFVIPIKVGDTILTGKFRNRPVKVKEVGIDSLGQPTINGTPILKFRIPKYM